MLIETKGVHLKNENTDYKKSVFDFCNKLGAEGLEELKIQQCLRRDGIVEYKRVKYKQMKEVSYMREALIKLQIGSLEQQLKALRSKVSVSRGKKTLSDLYGIYEGKFDLSLEEIKKHEYSFVGKI
jgi:hypothetical protein